MDTTATCNKDSVKILAKFNINTLETEAFNNLIESKLYDK